eukprot:scaffold12001_cov116-Isochrysis_galbana.AAC.20
MQVGHSQLGPTHGRNACGRASRLSAHGGWAVAAAAGGERRSCGEGGRSQGGLRSGLGGWVVSLEQTRRSRHSRRADRNRRGARRGRCRVGEQGRDDGVSDRTRHLALFRRCDERRQLVLIARPAAALRGCIRSRSSPIAREVCSPPVAPTSPDPRRLDRARSAAAGHSRTAPCSCPALQPAHGHALHPPIRHSLRRSIRYETLPRRGVRRLGAAQWRRCWRTGQDRGSGPGNHSHPVNQRTAGAATAGRRMLLRAGALAEPPRGSVRPDFSVGFGNAVAVEAGLIAEVAPGTEAQTDSAAAEAAVAATRKLHPDRCLPVCGRARWRWLTRR